MKCQNSIVLFLSFFLFCKIYVIFNSKSKKFPKTNNFSALTNFRWMDGCRDRSLTCFSGRCCIAGLVGGAVWGAKRRERTADHPDDSPKASPKANAVSFRAREASNRPQSRSCVSSVWPGEAAAAGNAWQRRARSAPSGPAWPRQRSAAWRACARPGLAGPSLTPPGRQRFPLVLFATATGPGARGLPPRPGGAGWGGAVPRPC